jgi:hypothetical protein
MEVERTHVLSLLYGKFLIAQNLNSIFFEIFQWILLENINYDFG